MTITAEESEAYKFAMAAEGAGLTLRSEPTISLAILANALRRHVAAEMRLEWEDDHFFYDAEQGKCCDCPKGKRDPRHHADWDRAAHEALKGEMG